MLFRSPDPRVRKISFTGSTPVGRALLHEAADQVISCAMELGGNAPFIVCKDANLNDALDGAMLAKMRNSGEACTAANRFYVHKDIYGPFTDGMVKRMSAIKLGAKSGCARSWPISAAMPQAAWITSSNAGRWASGPSWPKPVATQ